MIVVMAHQPAGLFRTVGTDLPKGLAVRRQTIVARQKVGIGADLDAAVEVQQVQLLTAVGIVTQVAGPIIVAMLPVKIRPIASKVGLGTPTGVVLNVVTIKTEFPS